MKKNILLFIILIISIVELSLAQQKEDKPINVTFEKWNSLSERGDPAQLSISENQIIWRDPKGKQLILTKRSDNNYIGDETTMGSNNNPHYREFIVTFLNNNKLNIYINEHYQGWLGEVTNTSNGIYVKNLEKEREKAEDILKDKNIIYRNEFKLGKIGENYIPIITGMYNAGKKYKFGDLELQEEDWHSYIKKGGYSKDVQGYIAVYQLINKSNKNYLIAYKINGNAKMTEIIKTYWGFSDYTTKYDFTDMSLNNTIVLKPNQSYKDQLVIGISIPPDFAFLIDDVTEVTNDWLQGLNNALTGNNLNESKKYLSDSVARKYYSDAISRNISRIKGQKQKNFDAVNRKYVSVNISPDDASIYDEDFDSKVILKITNKSVIPMRIYYNTPFGNFNTSVNSKSTQMLTKNIKGIKKTALKAKVLRVESME